MPNRAVRRDPQRSSLALSEQDGWERQVEGVASMVEAQNGRVDCLARELFEALDVQRRQLEEVIDQNRQLARCLSEEKKLRVHVLHEVETGCVTELIFHAWRNEVMKTGIERHCQEELQQFQQNWESHLELERQRIQHDWSQRVASHKDHVRLQHDLLLRKWAFGETKGLSASCLKAWQTFATRTRAYKKQEKSIEIAIAQWQKGLDKGIIAMCFRALQEHVKLHVIERSLDESNRKLGDAEKKIQAGMEAIQKRGKNLEIAMAQWQSGLGKGSMAMCFRALQENRKVSRERDAKKKSVDTVLMQWARGKSQGMLKMCWMTWSQDALESLRVETEKQQLLDLLKHERAEFEREWKDRSDNQQSKTEAAHNAVQLVCAKWVLGNDKGLASEVCHVWSTFSLKRAAQKRRLASLRMSVAKWARGDAKGSLQVTFSNWKNDTTQAVMERKSQVAIDSESRRMREMLDHERRQADKSQQALDKAKAAVYLSVSKWGGNEKGIKSSYIKCWQQYAKWAKESARQRKAVQDSLLRFFVGKDKAALKLTFEDWRMLAAMQKTDREQATELSSAQATTELMLRKWIFRAWHMLVTASKSKRGKRASVTDSVMRFLEGEERGIKHSTLLSWHHLVAGNKHVYSASDVEQMKADYEDQLRKAYQHIEHISQTLQKELHTKEEMAQQLMDAYKMGRTMSTLPDLPRKQSPQRRERLSPQRDSYPEEDAQHEVRSAALLTTQLLHVQGRDSQLCSQDLLTRSLSASRSADLGEVADLMLQQQRQRRGSNGDLQTASQELSPTSAHRPNDLGEVADLVMQRQRQRRGSNSDLQTTSQALSPTSADRPSDLGEVADLAMQRQRQRRGSNSHLQTTSQELSPTSADRSSPRPRPIDLHEVADEVMQPRRHPGRGRKPTRERERDVDD
eukprot:TRINITY_DN13815_c0_g1_i1.p1 TRINITY_DN13815_c0_g1~~TRINITY_DN13815_c0_g1_i1.p1  ORF type:complete len:912 (-),score=158.67 TRINITY_DN13815_c0_g1_i1:34-2769(-)